MTNQTKPTSSDPDTRKNIIRRGVQLAFFIGLTAVLLFVSAGTLNWPFAWVYLGLSVLIIIVNALIFPPELIAERGRKKEDVEKWDRSLTRLMLVPWFAIFVVAGLDRRFGWTDEIPLWIPVAGSAIFLLGNALDVWAMTSNRFFSTAVRIQYERGHTVCSSGPYHYVRHPGYLGMILYQLSSPLIFGSLWTFIPVVLSVALFVVRTAREDRTLKEKLEGYREYAEKVKWRLVMGVW